MASGSRTRWRRKSWIGWPLTSSTMRPENDEGRVVVLELGPGLELLAVGAGERHQVVEVELREGPREGAGGERSFEALGEVADALLV